MTVAKGKAQRGTTGDVEPARAAAAGGTLGSAAPAAAATSGEYGRPCQGACRGARGGSGCRAGLWWLVGQGADADAL